MLSFDVCKALPDLSVEGQRIVILSCIDQVHPRDPFKTMRLVIYKHFLPWVGGSMQNGPVTHTGLGELPFIYVVTDTGPVHGYCLPQVLSKVPLKGEDATPPLHGPKC